jgi:hypothetical protein
MKKADLIMVVDGHLTRKVLVGLKRGVNGMHILDSTLHSACMVWILEDVRKMNLGSCIDFPRQ